MHVHWRGATHRPQPAERSRSRRTRARRPRGARGSAFKLHRHSELPHRPGARAVELLESVFDQSVLFWSFSTGGRPPSCPPCPAPLPTAQGRPTARLHKGAPCTPDGERAVAGAGGALRCAGPPLAHVPSSVPARGTPPPPAWAHPPPGGAAWCEGGGSTWSHAATPPPAGGGGGGGGGGRPPPPRGPPPTPGGGPGGGGGPAPGRSPPPRPGGGGGGGGRAAAPPPAAGAAQLPGFTGQPGPGPATPQ